MVLGHAPAQGVGQMPGAQQLTAEHGMGGAPAALLHLQGGDLRPLRRAHCGQGRLGRELGHGHAADVVQQAGDETLLLGVGVHLVGQGAGHQRAGDAVLPEAVEVEPGAVHVLEGVHRAHADHQLAQLVRAHQRQRARQRGDLLGEAVVGAVHQPQQPGREVGVPAHQLRDVPGRGARVVDGVEHLVEDLGQGDEPGVLPGQGDGVQRAGLRLGSRGDVLGEGRQFLVGYADAPDVEAHQGADHRMRAVREPEMGECVRLGGLQLLRREALLLVPAVARPRDVRGGHAPYLQGADVLVGELHALGQERAPLPGTELGRQGHPRLEHVHADETHVDPYVPSPPEPAFPADAGHGVATYFPPNLHQTQGRLNGNASSLSGR